MKSYTQHIKQMYNKKKTFMIISSNINTQRTNRKPWIWIKLFLLIQISVHGCSYTTLCMLFLFSAMLIIFHNVTIHNEGVYIPIPSCALKLSNLEFNSIYFPLTTIIAFYLLRTTENHSSSVYILQVRFFLMDSFKIVQ